MPTEIKLLESGKIEVIETPPVRPTKPTVGVRITETFRKFGTTIGAFILIVIVPVIAILIPFYVLPKFFGSIPESVRGLFSREPAAPAAQTIEITASEEQITSGDVVTINWNTTSAGAGTLQYPCKNNTELVLLTEEANITVPCGLPYELTASTARTVALKGYTLSPTAVTIPITIAINTLNTTTATSTQPSSIEQTIPIIIVPDTATVGATTTGTATATTTVISTAQIKPKPKPSTPIPTTRVIAVPQYPQLVPGTDLKVNIVRTGFVNGSNQFVPSTTLPAGAPAVIEYDIRNGGTRESGPWQYRISVPSGSGSNRTVSRTNEPIFGPGAGLRYSLSFVPTRSMNGSVFSISITQVSQGDVNGTNNSAGVQLSVY